MALSNGPMLHAPSSTGFSVWVKGDAGALTYSLEVRKAGDTAWTVADTDTTDATYANTVVLTATGLLPNTEYQYQIKDTGVVVHPTSGTVSTWTMPASGRFILYHISDPHSVATATTAYDAALTDWETNYEPSSIPAVILQTGDLVAMDASVNWEDTPIAVTSGLATIDVIAGTDNATERIPIIYMFDDWDWGGNNSASNVGDGSRPTDGFQAAGDPPAAARLFYRTFWRGQPNPHTNDSFAFSTTIADVPIIITDGRSQRTQTGTNPAADGTTGEAVFIEKGAGTTPTIFGYVQRQWLIDQLRLYNDRGLVMLVSGTTFRSAYNTPAGGPAQRDSIGWYFKGERNYVMREGAIQAGYSNQRRLAVLSGDDHWSCVWHGELGEETPFNTLGRTVANLGLPFLEFKVACNASGAGLKADANGPGTYFHNEADPANCRWDITSTNAGRNVKARVTFLATADGSTLTSENATGDGNPDIVGEDGDFYWENGVFISYSATATEVSQVYPPENGPNPPSFQRWYEDDVTGMMVPESLAARDYYDRLRDTCDLDDPDRDELLDNFTWPVEDDPEDP